MLKQLNVFEKCHYLILYPITNTTMLLYTVINLKWIKDLIIMK